MGRVAILMRSGDARMVEVATSLEERGFDVDRFSDEGEAHRGIESAPPDLIVVRPADRVLFEGAPVLVLDSSHGDKTDAVRASEGVVLSAVERILASPKPTSVNHVANGEALQRLASLGLVAASVAHEISSPLAALWMELTELKHHMHDQPDAEEALEGALEAMDRMRVIVNDIRALSRTGDPMRVPCDVRGVIDRTLRLLRPRLSSHVKVTKEYGHTPLVSARDGRLGQLFVNLLSNAADALPKWEVSRNTIRIVTSMSHAGDCVVDVIDNGCGIAAEDLPHIFEPFFTTKGDSGTGLGLALCHGIVKSLGGHIEVESQPDSGSRFRIVLPPHASHRLSEAPPGGTRSPAALADKRVLILDRDEAFANALARALTPLSSATIVESLAEAAERGSESDVLLCEAPAADEAFQLLVERIDALRPSLPKDIVLMAGNVDAVPSMPAHRVIPKPFDVSQLMTLLERERWS